MGKNIILTNHPCCPNVKKLKSLYQLSYLKLLVLDNCPNLPCYHRRILPNQFHNFQLTSTTLTLCSNNVVWKEGKTRKRLLTFETSIYISVMMFIFNPNAFGRLQFIFLFNVYKLLFSVIDSRAKASNSSLVHFF